MTIIAKDLKSTYNLTHYTQLCSFLFPTLILPYAYSTSLSPSCFEHGLHTFHPDSLYNCSSRFPAVFTCIRGCDPFWQREICDGPMNWTRLVGLEFDMLELGRLRSLAFLSPIGEWVSLQGSWTGPFQALGDCLCPGCPTGMKPSGCFINVYSCQQEIFFLWAQRQARFFPSSLFNLPRSRWFLKTVKLEHKGLNFSSLTRVYISPRKGI